MKEIKLRKYSPETDFRRVRDFLQQNYSAFAAPVNWGIERWNYARYFIAPYLGSCGLNTQDNSASIAAIRFWEELVGIWENEAGEIVGVANIEHPDKKHRDYGEIFIQRHSHHPELLEEMLQYGEKNFLNPLTKSCHIFVYEDDDLLLNVVKKRGYRLREKVSATHLESEIEENYQDNLPQGYSVHTMQENNRISERCEIFGRSFNHPDPKDWPSIYSYQQLQQAPDYDRKNDFYITDENDNLVAQAIIWFDEINKTGHLEPLGTHPEHRGKKLAQELMQACFARLQQLGATKMPITGGFDPFYLAIGFRKIRTCYSWQKSFGDDY
ncbi:MAG: hypothetical protein APR54_01785 [Candidatus Cloacimonas sp. SDB]|nr:MAG: hypothetical protein APR54_01785 [Candidatus Cloacimonas sp. SDB]